MIDLQQFGFEDKRFARRFAKLNCGGDGGGDGGGGDGNDPDGYGGPADGYGGSGSGGGSPDSSVAAAVSGYSAPSAPAQGSPDSSVAAAVAGYNAPATSTPESYGDESYDIDYGNTLTGTTVSPEQQQALNMAYNSVPAENQKEAATIVGGLIADFVDLSMKDIFNGIRGVTSITGMISLAKSEYSKNQAIRDQLSSLGMPKDKIDQALGLAYTSKVDPNTQIGGDLAPEQLNMANQLITAMQKGPEAIQTFTNTLQTQADNLGKYGQTLSAFNQASIESALQRIRDVDTDIEYNKTLADLSGIQMDATEKALLNSQKQIAIDRALTTIEDTFSQEGDHIVAQQIQNLGTNALGGTIGQGFIKRWQEREAAAKTGALQDIESTYLAAERQAIDQQKQRQIDMWGKEYDADKATAEMSLDKAKAEGLLQYQWDQSYLQNATTRRGQDITSEQANLDRLLNERMGNVSIGAYEDANKWSTVAGVGGAIAGGIAKSDWFGDTLKSWWD